MKWILAFLRSLAGRAIGSRTDLVHNDSLRANQFNDPAYTFSYWRSLVG
jgi:hypothetical protein